MVIGNPVFWNGSRSRPTDIVNITSKGTVTVNSEE